MRKYEIIYNDIKENIHSGEYLIGETLPTELFLCEHYSVSRITIRSALFELEKDGYIKKIQGKGSIIVKNSGKTKTVLLVLPNIFKYIFSDLIQGIEQTLRPHNISLLIANTFNDKHLERTIIKNHIDQVDAIIFEPTQAITTNYSDSKTYKKLLNLPTVTINSRITDLDIPFLILNDEKCMKIVSEHIKLLGFKRVVIFAKTDDIQGFSRLLGVRKTFANTLIDLKIVEFTTENEINRMEDLAFLYFHFKPNCIMFYNDEYAHKFLSTYNINPIVDNLYISGFDNTEYSNGLPHNFVSPNHPKKQMGIDAANMILKLLSGNKVYSHIYEPDIQFYE